MEVGCECMSSRNSVRLVALSEGWVCVCDDNRIEDEAAFKVRIADAIKQIELANNSVLFTNRLVNDKLVDSID